MHNVEFEGEGEGGDTVESNRAEMGTVNMSIVI